MTRDETIDLIRREYAKGTRRADIADRLGISMNSVSRIASEAGIVHQVAARVITDEQIEFIRRNASSMTLKQLNANTGVNKTTLALWAGRIGVAVKGTRAWRPPVEAPAPEPDPFAPFVAKTLTTIHGRPMLAKRNAAGVALPYIASLGG